MNSLPNLSDVAVFIEVADTGSFVDAARRSGLTPSAVSKTVTRLEASVGVRLLRRTTRRVALTVEGERYLDGARQLLADAATLTKELSDGNAEPQGRLSISAPAGLGRVLMPAALARFSRLWPKLQIELSLDDRTVDLASGSVDLAIRSGTLADSATLVARPVLESQLKVCASPDYWARTKQPLSPDELSHHACLNFRSPQTGRCFPWVFSDNEQIMRRTFDGPLVVDDGEAVVRAALAGLGVSQMPGFFAQEAIADGRLEEVLVGHRPPPTKYSAVYLDRKLVAPNIRALIDFLVEEWK